MSENDLRGWWESLRHFGLLLGPKQVGALFDDHQPADLPRYRVDQLRRELNRFDANELDPSNFTHWVLEQICGLCGRGPGAWVRGNDVPEQYRHRLVTGVVQRPQALWTGERGGVLPVFIDKAKRVGIGRGRKTVSDIVQWLRRAGLPLALLTNGRQWRLLFAGLDFDAACEWDVDLWFEEGLPGPQLVALRLLFAPDLLDREQEDGRSGLHEAILASRRGQSELSSLLGERVREAVEALVRAHGEPLSESDLRDRGGDIYRAAVRLVMRMVVVLFAESRDLLPRDNPVYHFSYGLQGLFESLQKANARGRGRLARRFGAWPRVLSLFGLIHAGCHHEALLVPAYGGELFAPGERSSADPVSRALAILENACFEQELVPDSVVFHLLELLTRTKIRIRQGRSSTTTVMPVDFSDLSSEYIGILYEGLLDYELRTAPADDPIVFLAVGNEPALPLSRLEGMEEKQVRELFEKLKDTSRKEDDEEEETDDEAGVEAETEDEDIEDIEETEDEEPEETATAAEEARARALLWTRKACLAAGLVGKLTGKATPEKRKVHEAKIEAKARQLVRRVVLPGEWFLVRWGGTRKGAGTFYTRPQLAVPTVHRTLRPLAFDPPDGDVDAPAEQWKPKPPEEILSLKVCDPACGSGSFLVASLRFLTSAVHEALHVHGRLAGDTSRPLPELLGISSGAGTETELLPCRPEDDDFEARTRAHLKRHVVERCIYGVDLDPLAIELCRLALWIETMDRDLPFSFLDHKIRPGNSLIGCWFDHFQHYPVMAFKNREGGDKGHNNGVHFEKEARTKAIREFVKERLTPDLFEFLSGRTLFSEDQLEAALTSHDEALATLARLHDLPVMDAADRARIYREEFRGSRAWRSLKEAFDLWCALWFWPADELSIAPLPSELAKPGEAARELARRIAAGKRFFHWELEYPDVFAREGDGFDAVLGNPPWDIAKPNSKEFFSNQDPLYRSYGKQEALRKQTGYFAEEDVERSWLDYNADFKAQSNLVKQIARPFGDPEAGEKSQERYSIGRGQANDTLHGRWRAARLKSRCYADPAHAFRHQGSADINLYKLFLEQSHALLRDDGRLGLIIPSGLYSDHGTRALRELFLDHCRWEWLFGFENREKIFDIDSRFKFNPVIVAKGGRTEEIRAAFMRRKLEDWETAERFATPYTRERVARFSPRSRAILEVQTARDLEILEKIYANSVLLGDDGPDGWGIKYSTEFHMTNDAKLFPPRPKWEAKGYRPDEYSRWLLGEWKERTRTSPAPKEAKRVEIPEGIILSRDGEAWIDERQVRDVALPLYQGRMIWQFDYSAMAYLGGEWIEQTWETKTIAGQYLMRHDGGRAPRLAFRDVQNATNQRTFIGSILAPGHPAGNTVPVLSSTDPEMILVLTAALNSFASDRPLRLKMSQNHVNWFVAAEIPVSKIANLLCTTAVPGVVLGLTCPASLFADRWLLQANQVLRTRPWRMAWKLTECERIRWRSVLDAIICLGCGLQGEDLRYLLRECDLPTREVSQAAGGLDSKGFWRVDKDNDPELRHTVLTQIAFSDLTEKIKSHGGDPEKGIHAFLHQNDGEGWQLPETLCLADYGLGHDDRAKKPQPVASRLGPRFYDWQLEQDADESWRECELHARNLLGEEGYAKLLAEIEAERRGEKPQPRMVAEGQPRPLSHGEKQGKLF